MIRIVNWQNTLTQFIRYSILGFVTNSLGFSAFILLTYFFSLEPKLAMSILYFIGTIVSFIVNWQWVFSNDQNVLVASCRFLFAHLLGYFLNFTILLIFFDRLGYSYLLVQAIGIIIVAIFLFIIFKIFVFMPRQNLRREII